MQEFLPRDLNGANAFDMPDPTPNDPSTQSISSSSAGQAEAAASVQDVENKKISPAEIDFDYKNPRLTDEYGPLPTTDDDMVGFLYERTDVDELIQSISQNGYLPFDDMVIIKIGSRYRVLEGNRRLAALRILSNESLRQKLKITIPELPSEVKATIEQIPVKLVHDETKALAYIGFKHVNGPQKWDALAKAKFAVQWLQKGKGIAEIAKSLGDSHNTVQRLIFGYRVLEQAKRNGFRIDQITAPGGRFSFSHLYSALTLAGFQQYLGLQTRQKLSDSTDPISNENLPRLSRVTTWLFGNRSEGKDPIIKRQNPDLNRLSQVLLKSQSRTVLESTGDFKASFDSVEPKAERFITSLVQCAGKADEALKLSSDFDGVDTSVAETTAELSRTVAAIKTIVESKIGETKASH